MNIGQVKFVSWTVAGLLTLGLGAYVWSFVSTLETRRAPPDPEVVRAHLSQVQPAPLKNDGQVKYDDVRRLFNDLNWTGAIVRAPEPPPVEVKDLKPEVIPVRDLVRIMSVQVDLADPKGSSVFVKYKPRAQVANKGLGVSLVGEGESLSAPHDGIRIDSITTDGVTFAFKDETRAKETLFPIEFDARAQIVQVGPDGIVAPSATGTIPRREGRTTPPGKTTPIGANRFLLGTEDVQQFSDNYLEILSSDVRLRQHRDPRTGRYDGIEISDVAPGSLAERHGATQGDVVKSINGHPVNSTQEAINYVKVNKDKYSSWEVVIENKGKTRTVTYQSPD